MSPKRKPVQLAEEITPSEPHFVQILALPYVNDDGKATSSLAALSADGIVYKYWHTYGAWMPLTRKVLREV